MMIRLMIWQFNSNVMRVISILLLVWFIMSGPFALVAAISDFTHWTEVLFFPVNAWNRELATVAEDIPIFQLLPAWAFSLLYLCVLLGFLGWYYWTAIRVESRRLFEAAMAGKLDPVTPQSNVSENVEMAATAAAYLTMVFGAGYVQIALGSGAALLGGPLLAVVAVIAGFLAILGIGSDSERRKREAEAHARAETERLERERLILAANYIQRFRSQEIRKLQIAGGLALSLVILSFVGIPLYHWIF